MTEQEKQQQALKDTYSKLIIEKHRLQLEAVKRQNGNNN